MATRDPTRRKNIRALEAERDRWQEKKRSADEKLKVLRVRLKNARSK
jgi:hypothetical protein